MERDMDLVRQLLKEIRQQSNNDKVLRLNIEGRTDEEISYHIEIMAQADLVRATPRSQSPGGTCWYPISLTWDGQEFFDAAANDTTWNKTKALVKEKTGSLTFELLKAALIAWGKHQIGL